MTLNNETLFFHSLNYLKLNPRLPLTFRWKLRDQIDGPPSMAGRFIGFVACLWGSNPARLCKGSQTSEPKPFLVTPKTCYFVRLLSPINLNVNHDGLCSLHGKSLTNSKKISIVKVIAATSEWNECYKSKWDVLSISKHKDVVSL